MRSDLKAAKGVVEFETDLDGLACKIKVLEDVDIKELFDELAKNNDKFEDWSFNE